MDIEEINRQVEEEIKNNKSNKQFLMIKDIYCIEGLNLTPSLACFYSFLVFNSDRFMHNNMYDINNQRFIINLFYN